MKDIYDQLEIPEDRREVAVSRAEGEYLYKFITQKNLSKTLETGLGYGFSAVYIIAATHSSHIAIDPYAKDEVYQGIALKNAQRFGFEDLLEYKEEFSHIALPKLLNEKQQFDFIFIDGSHKFDNAFIDWYFCDLLLEQKGFIVFDDSWMRPIQRLVEFIRKNRLDYQEHQSQGNNFFIFQKDGTDETSWDHFVDFT